MRWFRRISLFLALVIAVGCIMLLMNFTAPNPTGRRYSSRPVVTSGGSQEIGNDGEMVLADDLHLPNNNAPDQKQCFCRDMAKANSKDCNACIPVPELASAYRIPDFVATTFIAESKNVRTLRDFEQIQDYSTAGRLLNRPLWLYVRVDTVVEPDYFGLVESTGGGVIHYFATPGYIDPIDRAADLGMIASLLATGGLGIWEVRSRQSRRFVSSTPSPKPTKPKSPKDPLGKAARKVDDLESFTKGASDRLRHKSDEEDSREDLK